MVLFSYKLAPVSPRCIKRSLSVCVAAAIYVRWWAGGEHCTNKKEVSHYQFSRDDAGEFGWAGQANWSQALGRHRGGAFASLVGFQPLFASCWLECSDGWDLVSARPSSEALITSDITSFFKILCQTWPQLPWCFAWKYWIRRKVYTIEDNRRESHSTVNVAMNKVPSTLVSTTCNAWSAWRQHHGLNYGMDFDASRTQSALRGENYPKLLLESEKKSP